MQFAKVPLAICQICVGFFDEEVVFLTINFVRNGNKASFLLFQNIVKDLYV